MFSRLIGHSGIIELLDWCKTNKQIIMIMERAEQAIDLYDYTRKQGRIKEAEARDIFKQVSWNIYISKTFEIRFQPTHFRNLV